MSPKRRIRPRASRLGAVRVGDDRRLVEVAGPAQLRALVADIGKVEEQVGHQLVLDAEVVLLDVRCALVRILRAAPHRRRQRRGIQESRRVAVHEPERGRRGDGGRARDAGLEHVVDEVWRVEAEQPFAPLPDGVRVEHAVAAPDHPARRGRVREADARRDVVAVRVDERAIEHVAVLGEDHLPGDRIEVREAVVLLARRRRVFVAQADVDGERGRELVVVLHEVELHVLPLIHHRVAGEADLRGQAEEQVADGAVGEPVLEVQAADRGVEIVDAGLDVQELAAELHEVGAAGPAERRTRIPRPRRLELRRRGVPARRIEALDVELGQAAHDRGVARHVAQSDLGRSIDAEVRRIRVVVPSRQAQAGSHPPAATTRSRSPRAPAPASGSGSSRTRR